MPTALLLVDIQQGLFMPPLEPHQEDAVVARIAALLEVARARGVPVFHVCRDGGEARSPKAPRVERWRTT